MWAIPTGTSYVLKKKKKRVPVLSLASRKPVRIRQSGRAGIRVVTHIVQVIKVDVLSPDIIPMRNDDKLKD